MLQLFFLKYGLLHWSSKLYNKRNNLQSQEQEILLSCKSLYQLEANRLYSLVTQWECWSIHQLISDQHSWYKFPDQFNCCDQLLQQCMNLWLLVNMLFYEGKCPCLKSQTLHLLGWETSLPIGPSTAFIRKGSVLANRADHLHLLVSKTSVAWLRVVCPNQLVFKTSAK